MEQDMVSVTRIVLSFCSSLVLYHVEHASMICSSLVLYHVEHASLSLLQREGKKKE